MKSAIAITALVAMVAAQSEAPTGSFTAGAWNPLNRWAGLDINANGRGFWIVRPFHPQSDFNLEKADA